MSDDRAPAEKAVDAMTHDQLIAAANRGNKAAARMLKAIAKKERKALRKEIRATIKAKRKRDKAK